MSGKLSPLEGEALYAARCAERKRIMEERAAKSARTMRSVGEEVEVRRSYERMTLHITEVHDTYYTVVQVFGGFAHFDSFMVGRWDLECCHQKLLQENIAKYYEQEQ